MGPGHWEAGFVVTSSSSSSWMDPGLQCLLLLCGLGELLHFSELHTLSPAGSPPGQLWDTVRDMQVASKQGWALL